MNLEVVTLSEISQTEKEKHWTRSLIRGKVIHMSLQNRKRLTDLENKLMVDWGKDRGKVLLGSLGRSCTHCYVLNA